jgi:hypothetical protein
MEGQMAIKGMKLVSLSVQQLIDCADEYWGNMGCRGGWPYYAWYYTQYFGLEDEKDYPYRGFMSKCKHRPRNALVATKRGEPYFEAGNVPWALKLAISKGPQAAAI